MRLVVFDYSGHVGQIQPSRWPAHEGHEVVHLHCSDYPSGKGDLTSPAVGARGTLTLGDVCLGESFARYRASARLRQEIQLGLRAATTIAEHAPEVVLLSNVPLLAHSILARRLAQLGIPMVFWQQDIYSRAITEAATRRFGAAGALIGGAADRTERRIALRSAATIAISDAYRPTLTRWDVPDDRVVVEPNWGPVDEVRPQPKDNPWARRTGWPSGRRCSTAERWDSNTTPGCCSTWRRR